MDFKKLGIIPKEKAEEVEKALTAEGYKLQKTSLAHGYIWLLPNYNSNRYMTVEYWCK